VIKKRVTLKDIAEVAGISYQTVSKVINGNIHISPEKEKRIWEVVHELDYHPNQSARSLRSDKTQMIGYTWAPTPKGETNPILEDFLQGMIHTAKKLNHYLILFPGGGEKNELSNYKKLIKTRRVDGFVLSSVEFHDPRIAYLRDEKIPFVSFGRCNADSLFPFVDVDGKAGMRKVTEHLIANGHRKIAVLGWGEDSRVGMDRLSGYLEAMKNTGIKVQPEWIIHTEGHYETGYQAACQLLELPDNLHPTAVAALNDTMALGVMRAVQDKGLCVGEDIAVTGFDDFPMTQYLMPSLTTVKQPVWHIGEQVVSMLVSILNNEPANTKILIKPELIVRDSSRKNVA
jgi:DNA-binding LacI/PurR family transcriptional regulator